MYILLTGVHPIHKKGDSMETYISRLSNMQWSFPMYQMLFKVELIKQMNPSFLSTGILYGLNLWIFNIPSIINWLRCKKSSDCFNVNCFVLGKLTEPELFKAVVTGTRQVFNASKCYLSESYGMKWLKICCLTPKTLFYYSFEISFWHKTYF